MQIDTRRLTTHTFAIGSSLAWGMMEFIALARVRWEKRKRR